MGNLIESTKKNTEYFTGILALVGGVASVISSFVKNLKEQPFIFGCAVSITILSLIVYLVMRYLNRGKPERPDIQVPPNPTSYIRGASPYEKGQPLLGRDEQMKTMLTCLEQRDYKFGYVSGEAGAGKTSFVRAKVIEEVEKHTSKPFQVIYLPAIKTDSAASMLNVEQFVYDVEKPTLLKPLIEKAAEERKRVLLVIDQFEEFFINYPNISLRKNVANEFEELIKTYNVAILLAMRKEFVEDLRDFAPPLLNPKSDEKSVYIKNWDKETAHVLFESFVKADGLRFAPDLRDAVINDLAANQYVRPVELQIVANELKKAGIVNLSGYNEKGRSNGILSDFIKQEIDGSNSPVSAECEKACKKYILKLLCHPVYEAKNSAGGLSYTELLTSVKASITGYNKELIAGLTDNDFKSCFDSALQGLAKRNLLVNASETHYNLVHDYLVKAIRMATADVQSIQERADALLNQYAQKVGLGFTFIPWSVYKIMKNNASAEAKSQPAAKKVFASALTSYCVLFITLLVMAGLSINSGIKTEVIMESHAGYDIVHDDFPFLRDSVSVLLKKKTNDSLYYKCWDCSTPFDSAKSIFEEQKAIYLLSPNLAGTSTQNREHVFFRFSAQKTEQLGPYNFIPPTSLGNDDFLYRSNYSARLVKPYNYTVGLDSLNKRVLKLSFDDTTITAIKLGPEIKLDSLSSYTLFPHKKGNAFILYRYKSVRDKETGKWALKAYMAKVIDLDFNKRSYSVLDTFYLNNILSGRSSIQITEGRKIKLYRLKNGLDTLRSSDITITGYDSLPNYDYASIDITNILMASRDTAKYYILISKSLQQILIPYQKTVKLTSRTFIYTNDTNIIAYRYDTIDENWKPLCHISIGLDTKRFITMRPSFVQSSFRSYVYNSLPDEFHISPSENFAVIKTHNDSFYLFNLILGSAKLVPVKKIRELSLGEIYDVQWSRNEDMIYMESDDRVHFFNLDNYKYHAIICPQGNHLAVNQSKNKKTLITIDSDGVAIHRLRLSFFGFKLWDMDWP